MARHVRILGGVRIVRHHHNRFVEAFIQPLQNLQDFRCRITVEVAGRFVGENQRGIADDGASDGYTLLLSARQLLGQVMDAILKSHELERGHHVIAALLRRHPGQQQRQLDILKRRQHRNQVESLKNIADVSVAPLGGLPIVQAKNVFTHHQQFAGTGAVNGCDHVQQGGLARSGRPHQRQELAAGDVDGDVVERGHFKSVALENLAYRAGLDDLAAHGRLCRWCCCGTHDCPLIRIFCPSFKSAGPAVITFSPPTSESTR